MTDNQIKWVLKYAKYLDDKECDNAEIVAMVVAALKNNLFPAAAPSFNEEEQPSIDGIFELMTDPLVVKHVKAQIEHLEVVNNE